jgi:eukaryotic-like serine/threonine-protein kinase
MPLQAGLRLGPYELQAPIGAGGMGEVWRGRDTRLDRSVAVKLLPAGLAQDEDRRQRFEREAKTISSLNHPHICTLFDVGHEGDTHFLVMELLEGESLADRVPRGPLPLEHVVKFGAQVADALDAAHKQGIVHRDLKPANVMLTKGGAKLLDFGLARSAGGIVGLTSSTQLPTEAKPLTSAGTLVGTFQYMAPEQLEGAEADARTDIFALGSLLYEMATGKRAFEGKSKTSLIAAILSTQPPSISSVQPVMPPALDHVVRRCLEKDPDDRWQSAHDVASELRWIGEAGSQAGVPAPLALRRRSRERLAWGLVAALGAASIGSFGWALRLKRGARLADHPFRSDLVAPAELPFAGIVPGAMALSPDGRRLAFIAAGVRSTPRVLAVRDLVSNETKPLAGTDGALFPFWAPDSDTLAFFAEGQLKKVAAGGGPVQVVCEAQDGRGGSWSRDGTIVFAPNISGALMRVPASGGPPVAVTRTNDALATHRNPWFLPDGRHFLFTLRESDARMGSLAVGSIDGDAPRVLAERGSNPQYADGFLFSVVDGNLTAQRFDAGRLKLEGQAQAIAGAVQYYNPRDLGQFSVTAGLVAYRQAQLRRTRLAWFDRTGKELAAIGEPAYYARSSLSAGGEALAAVRSDPAGSKQDIWLLDLARSQATRSTFASAPPEMYLALSPDAARLAVCANPSGGGRAGDTCWIQPSAGGGSSQTLLEKTGFSVNGWTPDSKSLIGDVQEAGTGWDVAYLTLGDPAKVVHVTQTRFDEQSSALSPNGRWIAYQSNETGRNEVFICDFPSCARRWQVSRSGASSPTWRGDARELYFAGPEGAEAVAVTERNGALDFGPPATLPFPRDAFADHIQSVDGTRFVARRYDSEPYTEPVHLIRGWRQLVEK